MHPNVSRTPSHARADRTPRPIPRMPRVPHLEGLDPFPDDEPNVVVRDELLARDTVEVAEEDILTAPIDARAARAHVAALRLAVPTAPPFAPAASAPPSRRASRDEPTVAFRPPRKASRAGALLAIVLGVAAFFGGWRVTGGAEWLDRATLGPDADHALSHARATATRAAAAIVASLR